MPTIVIRDHALGAASPVEGVGPSLDVEPAMPIIVMGTRTFKLGCAKIRSGIAMHIESAYGKAGGSTQPDGAKKTLNMGGSTERNTAKATWRVVESTTRAGSGPASAAASSVLAVRHPLVVANVLPSTIAATRTQATRAAALGLMGIVY